MIDRRAFPGVLLLTAVTLTLNLTAAIDGRDLQVHARDPEWVAPPEAASKSNPLAGRPDAEPGGRKLFQQRCASCHGEDGRGTQKAPDLTQPEVQSEADGVLFWKMSSGNTREGMPGFSFLPAPQRWQLVLRLRSLADDQSR